MKVKITHAECIIAAASLAIMSFPSILYAKNAQNLNSSSYPVLLFAQNSYDPTGVNSNGASISFSNENESLASQTSNYLPPTLQEKNKDADKGATSLKKSPTQEENDKVLLIADDVLIDNDTQQIEAHGNIEARNKGKRITADQLFYDKKTGIVKAFGNIVIVNPDGSSNYADKVTLDDKLSSGVAENFASRFKDGATVASKTAVKNGDTENVLSSVIYTACTVCKPEDTPTWEIRAKKATQHKASKNIIYHDVVFEIKGIPVLYIPYFRHGDPTAERQSGFEQPRPGRSGRLGYYLKAPYYHVIDDYSDVTFTPLISQYVNPLLMMDYRRNFYSGRLNIDASVTNEKLFLKSQQFYGKADWRSHIFADGKFNINDNWKWGFGIENASDDLYLSRYRIKGQGDDRGPIRTASGRLVNQLYLEGKDDDYFARILAASFQDIVSQDRRINTPKILPSGELEKSWDFGPWGGRINSSSSFYYLERKENYQDTASLSSSLDWSGQKIIGNGIVLTPYLGAKADYFNYIDKNNISGNNSSYSRANANANLDFKWPLYKNVKNSMFTIEPRLNLNVGTNNTKYNDLSIENAIGVENNYSSYFLNSRNSISDLWINGTKATAGVTFGATDKKDAKVNLFLGKQYLADNNSQLSPSSNLDKKNGDWVSSLDLTVNKHLNMSGYLGLDSETNKLSRAEVITNFNYGRFNLYARYDELPLRESSTLADRELVTNLNYKINKNYSLFVNNWYDYRSKKNLNLRTGLIMSDNCTEVRIYYEKIQTTNPLIPSSDDVSIDIAFKTLGKIDDNTIR